MNAKHSRVTAAAILLIAVAMFTGIGAAEHATPPSQGGDCDDTDPDVFPGADPFTCGVEKDWDCDGNDELNLCPTENDAPSIDSVSPSDSSTVNTDSPELRVEASDPNGDRITIEIYTGSIEQGSKTCTGSCSLSAEWNGLTDGESYTWTASVEDVQGASNAETQSFTVSTGSPPTADAGGPYTVDEGSAVALDAGGSSDPDGDSLSYSWSVSRGSVSGSGERQTYHAPTGISSDTDVSATLTVNDGSATDSDSTTIMVNNLQDQCGPNTNNTCPGNISVMASTSSPTDDRQEPVDYEVEEENLDSCSASGGSIGGSWDCSESDNNNDDVYQGTCDPQEDMSDGDHDVTVTCEDTAGNTGSDTVDLVVDTTAPSVSCDDCADPDPVQSGTDVTFDPVVSDGGSGVESVTICADEQCTDTYCSTSSGTSCSYTTPDNTFETEDFWIQATDNAGNTVTVGAGGGETDPSTAEVEQSGETFTMKKGIGEQCSSNVACYIGSCVSDEVTGLRTCDATVIPEPGIILR